MKKKINGKMKKKSRYKYYPDTKTSQRHHKEKKIHKTMYFSLRMQKSSTKKKTASSNT